MNRGSINERIGYNVKYLIMEVKEQSNQKPTADNKKAKGTTQQISVTEKKEIITLIQSVEQSKELVENTESSKPKNNELGKKQQISSIEKQQIINLICDNHSKHSHTSLYSDIDFDSLTKAELVEIIEDIVEETDITIIKSQVAQISTAFYNHVNEDKQHELSNFISNGGAETDFKHAEDELEVRFNKSINKYRHNKSKFNHNLEAQKQNNLKLKYELLDELKELISSEETLKKTYDEFKVLQDKWKEIGQIPASELKNLWQNYHFLVEKFFDKVRINRELRDLDLKKNLEAKVKLCEQAEELIFEKSIIKSFKLLQHYHDKWREIGPVPSDVKEDIWERFKGISDKINSNRKEYYKKLQDQQEANYEAKTILCEKAKEIISVKPESLKGWQTTTDKVNELLKTWKTIGRAPKSKNDEIWATFKGSLNDFFNAKRAYLTELKEQQVNNYNLKLDLCAKAEAIADSTEWGSTTRELIGYQKEWKKIGPVPRKYSDKVWKRFRTACDSFFNRKSDHFKNIQSVEGDNLKTKKELISAISAYKVSENKSDNLTALKDFQKKWIEIGFVPFKEKEKIQSEYRSAINDLLSKMDVKKSELSVSDFKDKIEILKSSPDGDRKLAKEKAFIHSKIKSIKDDLNIWENNIGFFSNSKQSSKLVEGFTHKIAKAKTEIEELKNRLKLIK